MAPPDADLLASIMQQMGLSPARVSSILQDPSASAQLARFRGSLGLPLNVQSGKNPSSATTPPLAGSNHRQGQSSQHRHSSSERHRLIETFNAESRTLAAEPANSHEITSYIGLPKNFSEKPLSELERIEIAEMEVSKMHKGRYLLCRIVSRPVQKLAVSFAIEDPSGRAEYFSVYNYPLHGIRTGPDLDSLFPLGQLLAIREPTFKMNQSNTSTLIRVDSPSDLHFISSSDALVTSVHWASPNPSPSRPANLDLREIGNSYFKAKKYLLAVKAYTDGIPSTASTDQQLLLHLNRSQANLALANYDSAVQDANKVLELLEEEVEAPPNTKKKAILRRSRGYEGLRRFSLALSSYEELLTNFPEEVEARSGIARMKKVLHQAATGEYDWLELARIAKSRRNRNNVVVGDYVGSIEAKEITERGGGRGVFATKAIKPGELLLVETAYATGRQGAKDQRTIKAIDIRTGESVDGPSLDLIENVVRKALAEPSSVPALLTLYGGEDYPAVSTPATLKGTDAVSDFPQSIPNLDIARIEQICSVNSFGGRIFEDEIYSEQGSSTLFLKASFINHRCVSNATWSTSDNIMVVRARTAIEEGEEVFVPYFTVQQGAAADILKKHCGNTGCDCSLCNITAAEGHARRDERHQLKLEYQFLEDRLQTAPFPSTGHSRLVRQLEALITKIEKTYLSTRSEFLRPELASPLHVLAESQEFEGSGTALARSIELDLRSLAVRDGIIRKEANGIQVFQAPIYLGNEPVSILLACARRFARTNNPKDNEQALAFLAAGVKLETLISGGGYPVFRFKHGEDIELLGLSHLVDLLRT